MKLHKLIYDLRSVVKIVLLFCRRHYATLSMIQGLYTKQPLNNDVETGIDTMLSIKAYSNFYQVTRIDYISNLPANEETWLAAYGWHSNGHFFEVGGSRYCIFDTASKSLYLETITEEGKIRLELFIKNL